MPWTCDLDDEDDRGTAVRELERRDMVVLLAPAPGEIARPATIARGGELSISLPVPRFRGGKEENWKNRGEVFEDQSRDRDREKKQG